jgi:hypothetical protein
MTIDAMPFVPARPPDHPATTAAINAASACIPRHDVAPQAGSLDCARESVAEALRMDRAAILGAGH